MLVVVTAETTEVVVDEGIIAVVVGLFTGVVVVLALVVVLVVTREVLVEQDAKANDITMAQDRITQTILFFIFPPLFDVLFFIFDL